MWVMRLALIPCILEDVGMQQQLGVIPLPLGSIAPDIGL
jgi:hypothetical protein